MFYIITEKLYYRVLSRLIPSISTFCYYNAVLDIFVHETFKYIVPGNGIIKLNSRNIFKALMQIAKILSIGLYQFYSN